MRVVVGMTLMVLWELMRPATAASPPVAIASNGTRIHMPEIAGLSCEEMRATLKRIDQSNYRGVEPLPPGHPDWRIFEYEDRIAASYYFNCILPDHRLDDPAPSFSHGFRTE